MAPETEARLVDEDAVEMLLVAASNPGVGVCPGTCIACIRDLIGYSSAAFTRACRATEDYLDPMGLITAAERIESGEV